MLIAPAVRAEIDVGLYPFDDECGPEIDEYCADVAGDLGDCMVANEGFLGADCADAVYFWAGDRYGWHGRDFHERWNNMSREERHAYASDHRGNFREFMNANGYDQPEQAREAARSGMPARVPFRMRGTRR